eukprot:686747-Amphidinium_carterae.1
MRPLSCSNIGCKIVNRAVAWKLRLLFPAIHHCQHGFRPGQPVSTAVFDLERIALSCVRDHRWSGIFFTDIAQAFPSLSRAFIQWVVRASGADDRWRQFFAAWLRPSAQYVHWGGKSLRVISMVSGCAQGDPLSPLGPWSLCSPWMFGCAG